MQISFKSALISALAMASTTASSLTWAGAVVAPPVHLTYPKKMTAQFVWNQVLARQATYIQDGNKGPIIYDFQDPNCPYCHVLYKAEAPLIRAGLLTVRYVPVAFISPDSLPEAAAWLQAPQPRQALQHFESIIGSGFQNGGTKDLPKAAPTEDTRADLRENMKLLGSLGFQGTPAIVFRVKSGQLGRIPGSVSEAQLKRLLPKLAP
ncbi:conserved exported protein of unknown function [Acidithiobacillus ferrivorans]|uniref:Disulfide isomerase n=1 Tax=Acidithiobacillus ferrivorans TaxID=160808 RepID=A0A060UNY9_9PROT|nr:thioredoxin fold domain-containing protein [Acidithiobacillus ferrivorans]MBN6740039.1 thioredoxin fold domain-containing protein [Acidithiobacillus sp. MC6.1]OCB02473.1 disulfide isomerase [Acidithiobacillus ferrivorans]QQD73996.1 thioredoxin fold domain-containing protein [Acidithiobacillus ferrivorans]CDQ10352.1 conserved exported hypothetical protein [Acidithiobacillus ferrivorans]SMH64379.1 conserved exported protein of unknown function [Acidithiobacillus ferrivorans]